jgi:hypothetical protein
MTTVVVLGAAFSPAQTVATGGGGPGLLQQASALGGVIGPWQAFPLPIRPVTGSPVSATEERHTVQTLGDGTNLENSSSNLFYRDSQGRTRSEQTTQGKTAILIYDPVAGFTARLDPVARTAVRSNLPGMASTGTLSAGSGTLLQARDAAGGLLQSATLPGDDQEVNREDLGTLNQNGVAAQGTRTTLTIPLGKIGNDRPIRVVNERWFSADLQMVVKSINSDPRFGTTTYQLTNIGRANPDASLFQIPSDYSVSEGSGRGGRGGRGGVVPSGR